MQVLPSDSPDMPEHRDVGEKSSTKPTQCNITKSCVAVYYDCSIREVPNCKKKHPTSNTLDVFQDSNPYQTTNQEFEALLQLLTSVDIDVG